MKSGLNTADLIFSFTKKMIKKIKKKLAHMEWEEWYEYHCPYKLEPNEGEIMPFKFSNTDARKLKKNIEDMLERLQLDKEYQREFCEMLRSAGACPEDETDKEIVESFLTSYDPELVTDNPDGGVVFNFKYPEEE